MNVQRSPLCRLRYGWLFAFAAALAIAECASSIAQDVVRTYDVNFTENAPTIDGAIDAGEWDAAPLVDGWTLLREPAGLEDLDNSGFRAMWDSEAFYLLLTTEFNGWDFSPGPDPTVAFGDNNWNIYWDPNTDGDPNFPPEIDPTFEPVGNQDNYQIAFSQYEGSSLMQGMDFDGNWLFVGARYQDNFGNNTEWRADVEGMRDLVIAQTNDGLGGVAEVKVPWTEFDAAAEIEVDMEMVETGLHHPMAPNNGDTWFFQLGRISTDPVNFLPVLNWHPGQFFAEHPHAEITFVGGPDNGGDNIPGDYDGDDFVGQGDIDLVLLNWGADVSASPPAGWTTNLPTGSVDQDELDSVLLNWGNAAPVGASAVPEPASWSIVLLILGAAAAWRRRAG